MSGPKARCPSCGSEWEAPGVFCGECGAPMGGAGGRKDASKGQDAGKLSRAQTLAGALPGVPVSPSQAPPPPTGKATLAMPVVSADTSGDRPSRPSDAGRSTVLGMAAFSPSAAPPEEPPKPSRREGGKKGRRASVVEEIPRADARPVEDAPQIDVTPISASTLEDPTPAAPARPSVPAPSSKPAPGVDAEETKRLLEDLDAGFESIVAPLEPVLPPIRRSAPPVPRTDDDWDPAPEPTMTTPAPRPSEAARAARHEADMNEVRELFAGIAVAYARPLRDFMLEIAWGEPTREWLDVALPAAAALRRAAAAVELPTLDTALESYAAALELAVGEASIHLEVREMLAGAYARLVEAMPSVFALDGERGRREPIIVRSLLMQVPGVHKLTIDKLYAAGINGLDVFYAARPRELAEATGLDEALAAAICERFQRYRREVAELSPGKDRAKEREELARLTGELARQHEEHERAGREWSADAAARRARARKERADTMLAVDLLLAHLGEVDLARALAKLPFQQKIRDLTRYLDEAKEKSSAP